MAETVRLRYAPSPTGLPHIGNVRTALFNWLYARRHGGKFIVRLEDTDQIRVVPGAAEAILDGLEWLGINWDEGPRADGTYGPYSQSLRLPVYHEAANKLIEQGNAYLCYCTPERLAQMRIDQQQQKLPPRYDGRCRLLSSHEHRSQQAVGNSSVVRFTMPTSGITGLHDLIRGYVEWQNELLDDFIIIKSDTFPTYHLASVMDDHLMGITHVLRAEEWLPSTPRHLQIYQALKFKPPQFGHLPMILGPDRAKLSKRHGATSVLEYREDGYLPEALRNYMVLLGWSLDDKTEFLSQEQMVKHFALERVGKPAAIFDQEKLRWMNGVYIRQLSTVDLTARLRPFLERDLPKKLLPVDERYLLQIVPLIHERIKLLSEVADLTRYFFDLDLDCDPTALIQRGMDRESTIKALQHAFTKLDAAPKFEHNDLEALLRATASNLAFSPRQFFGTLRQASTGRSTSPPLFETLEVLGRERVLPRIQSAIKLLVDG